jgi:hypothetical protein
MVGDRRMVRVAGIAEDIELIVRGGPGLPYPTGGSNS